MMTVSRLNELLDEEFTAFLGGVYEHSPWVAARALGERPFNDLNHLVTAMRGIVDAACDAEKIALIRAHPDLAGKLARAGSLTPESTREQAGLGLDRLADPEYERFSRFNADYREKFGFPFIICARLTTKEGVLAAFESRLRNDAAAEIAEALVQIHHIARLRIEDQLG